MYMLWIGIFSICNKGCKVRVGFVKKFKRLVFKFSSETESDCKKISESVFFGTAPKTCFDALGRYILYVHRLSVFWMQFFTFSLQNYPIFIFASSVHVRTKKVYICARNGSGECGSEAPWGPLGVLPGRPPFGTTAPL